MSEARPIPSAGFLVKICGITREQDAEAAIADGADALGFNVFPASRRFIDLPRALPWIRSLDRRASRILVAVNLAEESLLEHARAGVFDAIQLHGDEPPSLCGRLEEAGAKVIKALPVQDRSILATVEAYPVRTILLDAHAPGEYGGTGRRIDWDLARDCIESFPDRVFLLSGGLNPDNVADAVGNVRPAGVDVASGVESSPGIKDAGKMREFIRKARAAV